jgi:hypothetical protein
LQSVGLAWIRGETSALVTYKIARYAKLPCDAANCCALIATLRSGGQGRFAIARLTLDIGGSPTAVSTSSKDRRRREMIYPQETVTLGWFR